MTNRPIFRLLFFLLVFIHTTTLQAQSFVVIETDTTQFPTIRAVLQLNSKNPPLETDFKVFDEDKSEVNFSLTNQEGDSTISTEKHVFILIEASPNTAGMPVDNFKKAVVRVIDRLSPNDRINIGYFGMKNPEGKTMTTLSTDFSSNFSLIQQDIEARIAVNADSNTTANKDVDIFKGIYEALDYIEKQGVSGRKILIVITSATKSDKSAYKTQDIVDKALKSNIPVYTVTYKTNNLYDPDEFMLISDKTNAASTTARKAFEVRTQITDFLDARPKVEEFIQTYALEFTTSILADGQLHQYEIQYQGESQVVNYTAPSETNTSSFFGDYGIFIIIVLGAVIGVGIWQYRERMKIKAEEDEQEQALQAALAAEAQQKKAEEERKLKALEEQNNKLRDQMRNLEQDFKQKQMQPPPQPQPMAPQKFDAKKTMISGGGGSPILMISSGGFSKNFPLSKTKITIGRNGANDIVIPEQTVSGNHALITIENGSFFLTDVGSTNGTFINGNRINKSILKSGDLIRLGAATCKFQL